MKNFLTKSIVAAFVATLSLVSIGAAQAQSSNSPVIKEEPGIRVDVPIDAELLGFTAADEFLRPSSAWVRNQFNQLCLPMTRTRYMQTPSGSTSVWETTLPLELRPLQRTVVQSTLIFPEYPYSYDREAIIKADGSCVLTLKAR